MDRAAIEIALDRGLTMDLLPEASQLFRDEDRNFLRIDGKGMRMQLDVHSLAIPDVKLIRTPRFSDARGYFCETFQRAKIGRVSQLVDVDDGSSVVQHQATADR